MKWNFSLLKSSLVFRLSLVEGELTSLVIRCSPDERTWHLKAVEGMTGLHLECPQPQREGDIKGANIYIDVHPV